MNEAWIAVLATLLGGGSVYGVDCLFYYLSARAPEKTGYDYTQLSPDQYAFLVRNGWNPPKSVQEFFGWLDCDGEFCDTKCYNSHPATSDELDAKWTATKPWVGRFQDDRIPPAVVGKAPETADIVDGKLVFIQKPATRGPSRYEMLHDLKRIGIEPPHDITVNRLRIIHDREMKRADAPWTSWITTEKIRG